MTAAHAPGAPWLASGANCGASLRVIVMPISAPGKALWTDIAALARPDQSAESALQAPENFHESMRTDLDNRAAALEAGNTVGVHWRHWPRGTELG